MKAIVVVGLLVAMGFSGCIGCTFRVNKTVKNGFEDRLEAEKVAKVFYDLQTAEGKKILDLFSADFIDKTGLDSLRALLKDKKMAFGNLTRDSLKKWETIVQKGQNPRATYFLSYTNTYENGRVTESFNLKKGFFGTLKIVDYRYTKKE